MEFITRAINNLSEKEKSFIGSLKDEVSVSKSEGFKLGLSWSIGSINDAVELEKTNCIYKQDFTVKNKYPRVSYKADCGFLYAEAEGYEIGTSNERLGIKFPTGQCMKCKRQISK